MDVRNLFNFRNVLQVFTTTNDVKNSVEHDEIIRGELADYQSEAAANPNALLSNNDIDPNANSCATWTVPTWCFCAQLHLSAADRAAVRRWRWDLHGVRADPRGGCAVQPHPRRAELHGPERRVRLGVELSF
jgi:hypothetical protein